MPNNPGLWVSGPGDPGPVRLFVMQARLLVTLEAIEGRTEETSYFGIYDVVDLRMDAQTIYLEFSEGTIPVNCTSVHGIYFCSKYNLATFDIYPDIDARFPGKVKSKPFVPLTFSMKVTADCRNSWTDSGNCREVLCESPKSVPFVSQLSLRHPIL